MPMARNNKNPALKGAKDGTRIEKRNAAEIMLYLSGLDYPRQRQELMNYAKSQKAPESILEYLKQLPNKKYTSPADVEIELRKSG